MQGTHRSQSLYSTDPTMTPGQIVTLYAARWSIEVTFQPFGCAQGEAEPTFSDALFTGRRVLWAETVLKQSAVAAVVPKLPRRFADFVLDQLAATR